MMHLAGKFRRLVKGWNRRPLTEADLYAVAERQGVLILEDSTDDMEWNGLYTVIRKTPVIIVRADLKGLERLWTLYHELGHHLLHAPATCFFAEGSQHKAEHEANAFAACALIPERYVRQMYLWDLYEVDEFAAKLFQIRLEVFENYKV